MTTQSNSTERRLRLVFKKTLGPASFVQTSAATIKPEWDSLAHIKLIMALEAEFEIVIPPRDIPRLYDAFHVVLDYVNTTVEER